MNLNHIKLPGNVIADLYKSSLISAEPLQTGIQEEKPVPVKKEIFSLDTLVKIPDWKSLGNNLKNILIISNNENVVYLPDDQLSFLTGILTACKMSLADVAIINFNNYPGIVYKDLISHLNSKHVLLYGVAPAVFGLPIDFPHFQPQKFAGTTYLYSPSLNELEKDKLLKSKLWICLKQMFNI